jgi:DNA adenine methylase
LYTSCNKKGEYINTTTLKPPHAWVGGKSRLAKQIVGLIDPNHNLYVEVFGGALNVLYAKELPPRANYREVANDFNSELVNLHRAIRNNPKKLQKYLSDLFVSRDIFNDIKSKQLKPRDNIEKASFFFYRLTQSFGSKGENFAMNAKSRKPRSVHKEFKKWSQRLDQVTIENLDFEKLIKEYDKEETLFYCDPPYVGTESYYKNVREFNLKDHKRLNKALKQIKGKFLLSYNDTPFIRELYKDFKIIKSDEVRYTLGANAHGVKKSVCEVFIMNY